MHGTTKQIRRGDGKGLFLIGCLEAIVNGPEQAFRLDYPPRMHVQPRHRKQRLYLAELVANTFRMRNRALQEILRLMHSMRVIRTIDKLGRHAKGLDKMQAPRIPSHNQGLRMVDGIGCMRGGEEVARESRDVEGCCGRARVDGGEGGEEGWAVRGGERGDERG